ncbi:alpha/beta-hydrolase [Amniculicola lignicola CBS 123094]|uniref:Carboxylic ester hydrolase n=1 Tax=Amniculicola lignicola CBS 123094 TaxID=1392246 RepID=A0A6A5WS25_9PLEO|nr:alpha/beta-hydrolase [Amniculicola lignicola CBS 123094]
MSLVGLAGVNAAVPHIGTLGAVSILSDNDLAANFTTRTVGAILVPPSTYAVAAQRCASLNERVWSPSTSNFSLGLDNALSYTAYVNANNGSIQYWVFSPEIVDACNAITINGTLIQKPCQGVGPGLCTNSGPISQYNTTDTRPELQVTVQSGSQNITGFRDFYGFQFRGIRFAPKAKRFTDTTLYEGSGSVDATKYGPGCLQPIEDRWPQVSEDCHFLNVWTPYLSANPLESTRRKKLKAVMFWIYGGGNTAGTATDPEKEGGNLASRGDVVVVSFNYRVGNLGFLAFNDGVHNGTYAISDILTALRWVNKNIENFGGDPKRITIWGVSAGAVNVRTLLAIPEAEGLFAGAIMQSGPGEIGIAGFGVAFDSPKVVYERVTKKVLKESGCDGVADELECMRNYDPSKWGESGRTQASYPTRDGRFIPYRGVPLSGPLAHSHKIPVMFGYNRDEWSYLFPPDTSNFTVDLERATAAIGIPLTHLANSSYAPQHSPLWSTYTEAEKRVAVFDATAKFSTDAIFACLTHAFAFSAVKNGVFDAVYEFQFNRTYQPTRWTDATRVLCGRDNDDPEHNEYYKCHAGEVPYTFGNILQQGWKDRDTHDTPFARLIVDYWSAFARTGTMQAEKGYLEARGFTESQEKMKEAGAWSSDKTEVMRLQWGGIGIFPSESDQVGCSEIGLGKDFYENFDYGSRS